MNLLAALIFTMFYTTTPTQSDVFRIIPAPQAIVEQQPAPATQAPYVAPKANPAPAPTQPQTQPTPYSCPEGQTPIGNGACRQTPTGCPYGDSIPMDMCSKFEPKQN